MDETPHWVRLACDRWGQQKRRAWAGGDWYIDHEGVTQRHIDGYSQCFLGRLLDERYTGNGGVAAPQVWGEVYSGDGLEVQRALSGMSEISYFVLHLRYVWDPEFKVTAARKAELIGVSTRMYWHAVELAERWVWSRLDCEHNTEVAQVAAAIAKIAASRLRKVSQPRTTSVHPRRLPELHLPALQRPTLHLPGREPPLLTTS